MTISGIILRFFASYLVLLLVVGQLLALSGLMANELVFALLLIGAAYWPCLSFGKRNQRYLSRTEKINLITGMIIIDLVFQILFGNVPLPGMAPLTQVALAFLLQVWLHGAALTLVVQLVGRQLRRQGITADSPTATS